ncbi:hypothetical protein RYX36_004370 [Vicia faba]
MHLEIVHEFYANALPMEGSPFAFKKRVRGKKIDFSRSAINKFLRNPCTLGDGELDEYHIQLAKRNLDYKHSRAKLCKGGHTYEVNALRNPLKFNRKSLKTKAQVLMFVVLYKIRPRSHTSSIPVETTCLLSYMLDEATIDIARVILNEMKRVVLSNTRLGDRISCQLTYSGLVMGLCKKGNFKSRVMVM